MDIISVLNVCEALYWMIDHKDIKKNKHNESALKFTNVE